MRIEFHERFSLQPAEVFDFFRSPSDWVRLYGMFGTVEDRGEGWYAVPLKGFPFPLVARTTELIENQRVRWTFRGFWRGEGEVRIGVVEGETTVDGFEEISIRWLWVFSPLVEKLLIEKRFRGIWRHGWRRLREQQAEVAPAG